MWVNYKILGGPQVSKGDGKKRIGRVRTLVEHHDITI